MLLNKVEIRFFIQNSGYNNYTFCKEIAFKGRFKSPELKRRDDAYYEMQHLVDTTLIAISINSFTIANIICCHV
jgi:hypothetical protein